MLKVYLIYTAIVSLITLMLFIWDKLRSKSEKNLRIPEEMLLAFTSLGGSVGALIGVYLVRHKTNFRTKYHFIIGTWFAFAIQAVLLLLMFLYVNKYLGGR